MESVKDRTAGRARRRPKSAALTEADIMIQRLRQDIVGGRQWYPALLETIGQWTLSEEECHGRRYYYLIGNEAFDWLLLAERICLEIQDLVPDDQWRELLFLGKPPMLLDKQEFRRLLGPAKYRCYLNYYYGVMAEGCLQLSVKEEERKEQNARCAPSEARLLDNVFLKIYDADYGQLLALFREQKKYSVSDTISLSELHEFTYWLFKYRLANCEPARIASDTRKGLHCLRRLHPELDVPGQ